MKLKDNFVIKQISGVPVAVYCDGNTADFRKAVILNGASELLFKNLMQETDEQELAQALMDVYDVVYEDALFDVREFLQNLREKGLLER